MGKLPPAPAQPGLHSTTVILLIMETEWAQVLLMWNHTKSFFHSFPREFCSTFEFPIGNIIFLIHFRGRRWWPPQPRAGYLGLTYVKWQHVKALKNMLAEVLRGVLQGSNIDYKLVHLGAWVGKCMKNAWEVCVRNAVHWCFIFIILFFFFNEIILSNFFFELKRKHVLSKWVQPQISGPLSTHWHNRRRQLCRNLYGSLRVVGFLSLCIMDFHNRC